MISISQLNNRQRLESQLSPAGDINPGQVFMLRYTNIEHDYYIKTAERCEWSFDYSEGTHFTANCIQLSSGEGYKYDTTQAYMVDIRAKIGLVSPSREISYVPPGEIVQFPYDENFYIKTANKVQIARGTEDGNIICLSSGEGYCEPDYLLCQTVQLSAIEV